MHADMLNAITALQADMDAKLNAHVQSQSEALQAIENRLRHSGTIKISDTELLTKIFSGLKMYLDPKDIGVAHHLAMDFVWEEEITQAWLSMLEPGTTIIDIGANFGYFGLLAAQLTEKKSKVIFFEANPQLIPYINKSLAANWYHEVSTVVNAAVADKPGKVTLNVLEDYIGSSTAQSVDDLKAYMSDKMDIRVAEKIEVDAVTIDDYCSQNKIEKIDLIKMDIEGFEQKAYQGMRQMVKKSPSITMFVEFTKESYENPERFYQQMLKDFGYVYVIDQQGKIVKPKTNDYHHVIDPEANWFMPVFSKKANLASR